MSADGRRSLIIVTGEEGAGKSTIIGALLPVTPNAARLDAEDVGKVNPCPMDDAFMELLRHNVAAVVGNFWDAGYRTVITGSFFRSDTYESYQEFRRLLPSEVDTYLVQLVASKPIRDERRIARPKPSSKEWRDRVDALYRNDGSLRREQPGYRYIHVPNDSLSIEDTVATITWQIPEIYGATSGGDTL